ncbi:MAG: acylneuraminate cytidylyltransferase family protein [Microbacteriaceae bacterium]|nr:acylneuraminate cytidylyltransferase family protein [Microbacteriaceae bacterium]
MMGETVAIIPARGGSVGIPRKNLQRVGDDTLVARAVRSARAAAGIHRVIVSTDDAEIALESRRAGAFIIDRPASLATSTASSESALLHALGALDRPVDVVVMLQATSPFIDPGDLDAAIGRVRLGEADAVFAAVATPVFLWRPSGRAAGWEGVNHDAAVRLRRQDLPLQVAETGAFYVMRAEGFRAAEHRFFGRVEPQLVDERFAVDIDTEVELEIARALAAHHDTEFRTPARRPAEENQP